MSVHVESWAWQQATGDYGTKLVLVKLAQNADDTGYSRWGLRRMAEECEMSKRTLQRKLAHLKEIGLLVVEERVRENGSQTANGYRLAYIEVDKMTTPPSQIDQTPMTAVTSLELSSEELQEPSETTSPQVPAEVVPIRPRNEVWDALTELFGPPGTRQKEIARGKVVGELRAAGIERGDQVHRLADEYRKTFSTDVALTQHALGKHADQLAHAIRGRQAKRLVAPCEFCGTGAGLHAADCVRPQAASG